MSATSPKRGEYVKVFQKPLTEEDYEGIARIARVAGQVDAYDNTILLDVGFRDDPGPYQRRVLLPAQMVPPKHSGF